MLPCVNVPTSSARIAVITSKASKIFSFTSYDYDYDGDYDKAR